VFHLLGKSIARAWFVWLILWIVILAGLTATAPAWEDVVEDHEFAFLPADAPSRQGLELLRKAFPNDRRTSNIVIVATRRNDVLQPQDRAFITDTLRPALLHLAANNGGLAMPEGAVVSNPEKAHIPIIASVRTLADKGVGLLLVSEDKHATLVVVDLTSELLEVRNWPIVAEVESILAEVKAQGAAPDGLELTLVGSAVVGRDLTQGQRDSARAVERWTLILVVGMLLLIHRAPLLTVVPLLSVALATHLSMKLLALLSAWGYVTVFHEAAIYITVILYGTGVDYCLFLIARYREEREHGAAWRDAMAHAVGHVGAALTASALTVIFGIGMMVFGTFGKFHNAGIAVALSLVVGSCVVLTFTTSLLRLLGPVAFWPQIPAPAQPSSEHEGMDDSQRVGAWLSWEALGRALLRRPALIWGVSVLLMCPLAALAVLNYDHVDYDFLRRLPQDAPSVTGANALEDHFPAGMIGTATVLIQHPDADFRSRDSTAVRALEALTDRLQSRQAELQLADIRSLTRPLGVTSAAPREFEIPIARLRELYHGAMQYYASDAEELGGQVTRLELTTTLTPMSRAGIDWLNQIETAIHAELPDGLKHAQVYLLGTTADMRDLRRVTQSDQIRIQTLAAASVLAILIVLLRRVWVSVYLIASVLFSYLATLGATLLVFWWLDGDRFVGLDWKVPLFLFTILIAVGEDYNIFLMTRIAEESKRRGAIEGIRVALVRTGRIITACGIIMAGTFASLLTGTMEDLRHLGFALAFGVLLDTFVVRPILVPAFLIMIERGWPMGSKAPMASAEHDNTPRSQALPGIALPQGSASPSRAVDDA
jgi:RND superfamily putative drug exporter